MSKQVNYPYTINTLSAKGSAEVIARGITNDYVTQWSYNTNIIDSWNNVENFPTVVRTGNFVWCWYRVYSDRAIYMLIDVVPDPEVEYQLGNNIAYPALLNNSVAEITPAVTSASVQHSTTLVTSASTVTDGPYYPLTVAGPVSGEVYIHVKNATNGYKSGFVSSNKSYKEIVADKWGNTPNVWGGFATSNHTTIPWLVGWGGSQTLLTNTNGNHNQAIYGIFAPFATYEQFQTLYGAESDWIYSTTASTVKTLFGSAADTGNGAGIQYSNTADIENDYPFTVEAMQPQTKYRNIPGDTNGDGFDNTPSFEDALATYGAVAGVFPGLDITKCGNLADLGLKIGDIDIPSINELKNSVKAAVDSAVDSIGLSKIDEMVQGFKDGLNDMLPDTTKIENLAKDISDLKDKGEDEYQKLVEKWDGLVDDIEGVIDSVRNLGGFDICQFVTDKAKTDKNGKLVKKEEAPSPPDRDIVAGEPGYIRAQTLDNVPQDPVQQGTGYTEAAARAARNFYNEQWVKLKKDPFIQEGSQSSNSNLDAGIDLSPYIGDGFLPKPKTDPTDPFSLYNISRSEILGFPDGVLGGLEDFGVNTNQLNVPNTSDLYPEWLDSNDNTNIPGLRFDFAKQKFVTDGVSGTTADFVEQDDGSFIILDPNNVNPPSDPPGDAASPVNNTTVITGVNYSKSNEIRNRKWRLLHRQDYQSAKAPGGASGLWKELRLEEKDVFKDFYIISYFDKLVAAARDQIESKLLKSTEVKITPNTKSEQLWTPPEYAKVGELYPTAIVSVVDKDDVVFYKKLINKLHSLINEKIITKEVLDTIEKISAGEIDSARIRGAGTGTMLPSASSNSEEAEGGDAVDERNINVTPLTPKEKRELGVGSVVEQFKGMYRDLPLKKRLMYILESVARKGEFKFVIYSAGNRLTLRDAKRQGARITAPAIAGYTLPNGTRVRAGGGRHDHGYAADIEIYDKNGTHLLSKNVYTKDASNKLGPHPSLKPADYYTTDGAELIRCIQMLLDAGQGALSVGAHPDYMGGNVHIDIASVAGKYAPATWGDSHSNPTTPNWLREIFNAPRKVFNPF